MFDSALDSTVTVLQRIGYVVLAILFLPILLILCWIAGHTVLSVLFGVLAWIVYAICGVIFGADALAAFFNGPSGQVLFWVWQVLALVAGILCLLYWRRRY